MSEEFLEITVMRLAVILLCVLASTAAFAQWVENPETGSPQEQLTDRTNLSGMSGLAPELKAGLVEQGKNATQKQAVVRAEVWGVHLISPLSTAEPRLDQGYLSFVLDDQAPIKTNQKEYTFTNLSPGHHTITVRLLLADGLQVGSHVALGLHIPR